MFAQCDDVFLNYEKHFVKSSNVDEKFFLRKKIFLLIGQNSCEEKFDEKKEFCKKNYFTEKGNLRGNEFVRRIFDDT